MVAVDGSGHQLHRGDQDAECLGKERDSLAEKENRVVRRYQAEARGRGESVVVRHICLGQVHLEVLQIFDKVKY